jgi:protein phosphatase
VPFRVDSAARSDVGSVRERNEDAYVIDEELGVYAVCDGMGGHVGGQVASRTAVEALVEALRGGDFTGEDPDRLATAIRRANRAVYRRAKSDPALHNMGTTIVAIRRDGDLLHLCHVGDSRIYRLREDRLEQVTRDHSLVNLYADNPALASRFGPAHDNVIVRAVGLHDSVDVDHRVIAMEHDDLYLLCSDGLTDMVDDWIIRELLADAREAPVAECAEALIRAALSNGGIDNVTGLVLRVAQD